jgi:hypothetical protein
VYPDSDLSIYRQRASLREQFLPQGRRIARKDYGGPLQEARRAGIPQQLKLGLTQQTNSGGGGSDAFVTKLNPGGTSLVYSTYLGGSNYDLGYSIDVDSSGNAYVSGATQSNNFSGTSSSPIQSSLNGAEDAFVTKLNATGTMLVYSTYLGGDLDGAVGIAVTPWGMRM